MDKLPYRRQFMQQRRDAAHRGIEFKFTHQQWLDWWGDDIIYRGNRAHELVMARHGDTGAYEPDNCYKCTKSENSSHTHINKPECHVWVRTPEYRKRQSEVHKGKGTKRIQTHLGVFDSVGAAADAEGVALATISNKLKTHPHIYKLL